MRRVLVCAVLVLAPLAAVADDLPTAEVLLSSSIARHDLDGAWASGAYRMVIRESRPDGSSRESTVLIDNGRGAFEHASLRDGDMIVGSIAGSDDCSWLVNGSPSYSDEDRQIHKLDCERLERMRNYYTYLWGLPMKLRDPGTLLGRVELDEFDGREALELRVTYDESVGNDVWYVYFEPESHELVGYRFYHDEAANDGEFITIDGMEEGAGLRLPRVRSWYMHQDGEFLGTDTLISVERP